MAAALATMRLQLPEGRAARLAETELPTNGKLVASGQWELLPDGLLTNGGDPERVGLTATLGGDSCEATERPGSPSVQVVLSGLAT